MDIKGLLNIIIEQLQRKYNEIVYSVYVNIPQIVMILIVLLVLRIIYEIITRGLIELLKRTMKRNEDIEMFKSLWKYSYSLLSLIIIFAVFSGSIAGLGFSLGLIAAAIGFAMQKPIASIAAWIIISVKRPFRIGDRVIIGDLRGDVQEISIMHITLREIGGTVSSEETSERIILIPNYILFDTPIINYTTTSPYILDELRVTITYESNWKRAEKILISVATKITEEIIKATNINPYVRAIFAESGIDLILRYRTIAKNREKIKYEISKHIYEEFNKYKDVEFAYPHREIILHNSKKRKYK